MNTNSNKKEKGILVLLLLVVLLMTVGFAAYSANLNINGTVKVKAAKWLVLWESGDSGISVSHSGDSDASGELKTTANEPTDFDFTVTLNRPGSYYEATIKAHNYGTFDAKLDKITMSTLTAAQQKYLKYTIQYNNGTTYETTTDGITGVTLPAGGAHPVKVRVEYLEPAAEADLPSGDVTVNVTGQLDYSQVN